MIINIMEENWGKKGVTDLFLQNEKGDKALPSEYSPDDETKKVIRMIVNSFLWSDIIMRKPRRAFLRVMVCRCSIAKMLGVWAWRFKIVQ